MKGSRFKLNQNHAPIHEALETFRRMRVVPFDVPGHKHPGQKCDYFEGQLFMKSYKMSLNGTELIYDINEHCVLLGNRRLQLNKDEIFPRPKIYFKINNACNMRCSYCFQQTEKSSEKKVDFRHYSILFDKLSSLTDYDFYAFGGEPLLDGNLENWQYLI